MDTSKLKSLNSITTPAGTTSGGSVSFGTGNLPSELRKTSDSEPKAASVGSTFLKTALPAVGAGVTGAVDDLVVDAIAGANLAGAAKDTLKVQNGERASFAPTDETLQKYQKQLDFYTKTYGADSDIVKNFKQSNQLLLDTANNAADIAAKRYQNAQNTQDWATNTSIFGEKALTNERKVERTIAELQNSGEKGGKAAGWGLGLLESAGRMAPTIAAAAVTGGLGAAEGIANAAGLAAMWPSVYAQSYKDSMSRKPAGAGAEYDVKAGQKAFGDATLEAATEMMFAGIGGLGNSGFSQLTGKKFSDLMTSEGVTALRKAMGDSAAGQFLSNALTKTAQFYFTKPGRILANLAGEGIEEMVSEIIQPYIERATTNPNAQNASFGDVMLAGLGGVVMAGLLSPGNFIGHRLDNQIKGEVAEINQNSLENKARIADQAMYNGISTKDAGVAGITFNDDVEVVPPLREKYRQQVVPRGDTLESLQAHVDSVAEAYKAQAEEDLAMAGYSDEAVFRAAPEVKAADARVQEAQKKLDAARAKYEKLSEPPARIRSAAQVQRTLAEAAAATQELRVAEAEFEAAQQDFRNAYAAAQQTGAETLMRNAEIAGTAQQDYGSLADAYTAVQNNAGRRVYLPNEETGGRKLVSRNELARERFGKNYNALERADQQKVDAEFSSLSDRTTAAQKAMVNNFNTSMVQQDSPVRVRMATPEEMTASSGDAWVDHENGQIVINPDAVLTTRTFSYILGHELLRMAKQSGEGAALKKMAAEAMAAFNFDGEEASYIAAAKVAEQRAEKLARESNISVEEAMRQVEDKLGSDDIAYQEKFTADVEEEVILDFLASILPSQSILARNAYLAPEFLEAVKAKADATRGYIRPDERFARFYSQIVKHIDKALSRTAENTAREEKAQAPAPAAATVAEAQAPAEPAQTPIPEAPAATVEAPAEPKAKQEKTPIPRKKDLEEKPKKKKSTKKKTKAEAGDAVIQGTLEAPVAEPTVEPTPVAERVEETITNEPDVMETTPEAEAMEKRAFDFGLDVELEDLRTLREIFKARLGTTWPTTFDVADAIRQIAEKLSAFEVERKDDTNAVGKQIDRYNIMNSNGEEAGYLYQIYNSYLGQYWTDPEQFADFAAAWYNAEQERRQAELKAKQEMYSKAHAKKTERAEQAYAKEHKKETSSNRASENALNKFSEEDKALLGEILSLGGREMFNDAERLAKSLERVKANKGIVSKAYSDLYSLYSKYRSTFRSIPKFAEAVVYAAKDPERYGEFFFLNPYVETLEADRPEAVTIDSLPMNVYNFLVAAGKKFWGNRFKSEGFLSSYVDDAKYGRRGKSKAERTTQAFLDMMGEGKYDNMTAYDVVRLYDRYANRYWSDVDNFAKKVSEFWDTKPEFRKSEKAVATEAAASETNQQALDALVARAEQQAANVEKEELKKPTGDEWYVSLGGQLEFVGTREECEAYLDYVYDLNAAEIDASDSDSMRAALATAPYEIVSGKDQTVGTKRFNELLRWSEQLKEDMRKAAEESEEAWSNPFVKGERYNETYGRREENSSRAQGETRRNDAGGTEGAFRSEEQGGGSIGYDEAALESLPSRIRKEVVIPEKGTVEYALLENGRAFTNSVFVLTEKGFRALRSSRSRLVPTIMHKNGAIFICEGLENRVSKEDLEVIRLTGIPHEIVHMLKESKYKTIYSGLLRRLATDWQKYFYFNAQFIDEITELYWHVKGRDIDAEPELRKQIDLENLSTEELETIMDEMLAKIVGASYYDEYDLSKTSFYQFAKNPDELISQVASLLDRVATDRQEGVEESFRYSEDGTSESYYADGRRIAQIVNNARAKYGATPVTDVSSADVSRGTLPDQRDERHKTSTAYKRTYEEAATNSAFANQQRKEWADGFRGTYIPTTNKQNMAKAEAWYKTFKTIDDALATMLPQFKQTGIQLDTALYAQKLRVEIQNELNRMAANGEEGSAKWNALVDQGMKLESEIALFQTRTGQIMQSFSLRNKFTPEGELYFIDRMMDTLKSDLLNRKGELNLKGWEGFVIPKELREELLNAKTEKDKLDAEKKIVEYACENAPMTVTGRVLAWRYLAMLGNPRTHIRNIASNAIMWVARNIKDTMAAAGEDLFLRGSDQARTKTLAKASPEAKEFAQNDWLNVMDIVLNGGHGGYATQIAQNRKQFKIKPLDKLNQLNSRWLELEDNWFAKSAYTKALASYMTANGMTAETFRSRVPGDMERADAARRYAINEATKAVYRDYSAFAAGLNKIEREGGVLTKLIIGGLMPFKKTPINILKRGVLEYSPIGVAKAAKELYDVMRKAKDENGDVSVTFAQAINDMAAGLTGNGILLLGLMLGLGGHMKGAGADKDKDEYYDQMLGNQQYSVTIGDTNFTLDWMTPLAIPLFSGVAIADMIKDDTEMDFAAWVDVLGHMADPVTNLSVLSGFSDALKTYGSGQGLSQLALSAAQSFGGQFAPTAVGQIARTIDNVRRTTYASKDDPLGKTTATFVNKMENKIPGLSMTNEPYINMWGNESIDDSNILWRFMKNSIFPWYSTAKNITEVDDFITTLAAKVGNSVLPSTPSSSVTMDGVTYNMAPADYTAFKVTKGTLSYNGIDDLIHDDQFLSMADEEQADIIDDVFKFANEMAKMQYASTNGIDYSPTKKILKIQSAVAAGLNVGDAVMIYDVSNSLTKDENLSKKQKQYAYYAACGLTEAQVLAFTQ